jgi:hypothetical protein
MTGGDQLLIHCFDLRQYFICEFYSFCSAN